MDREFISVILFYFGFFVLVKWYISIFDKTMIITLPVFVLLIISLFGVFYKKRIKSSLKNTGVKK